MPPMMNNAEKTMTPDTMSIRMESDPDTTSISQGKSSLDTLYSFSSFAMVPLATACTTRASLGFRVYGLGFSELGSPFSPLTCLTSWGVRVIVITFRMAAEKAREYFTFFGNPIPKPETKN